MDTETLRGVSSGDEYVAPQSQRWGKVALAVGAACALLVVGFATGSHFVSPQASQAVTSSVVAPLQLNQIAVVPPREECAKVGKNCIAQKCCKVTGYECYEVKPGMAQCMKECFPGKDGPCLHHSQTNDGFPNARHFILSEHALLLHRLHGGNWHHKKELRTRLA